MKKWLASLSKIILISQLELSRHTPTTLHFDTFQWFTGFSVLSLSPVPPPSEVPAPAAFTGCHGGITTKMLSNGFHSPPGEDASAGGGMGGLDGGRRGNTGEAVGACAVNTPSRILYPVNAGVLRSVLYRCGSSILSNGHADIFLFLTSPNCSLSG